ncbi:MAG: hypothetical protein K2Q45_06465 [Nitrosomonas sp.]|nr:hypothetical protein [Nitrosomonas sp.]
MRDFKSYEAPEEANLMRILVWLFFFGFLAALAWASNSDYSACMAEVRSIYLCGGGNNR